MSKAETWVEVRELLACCAGGETRITESWVNGKKLTRTWKRVR